MARKGNPYLKKSVKKQTLRNREYYNSLEIGDTLYRQSKEGKVFTKILELVCAESNIELAFRNIKGNKGSSTPGLDKKDIEWLANKTTKDLVNYVRSRLANYSPLAVKRVEIPKDNGKTRPLGIPAIGDRLIQQCILQVLDPICEAKFYDHSYGFRPNRGTKHAIARCYSLINRNHLYHVVDVDIHGFFDNIDHGKLLKQMYTMGIRDKRLICIISKMLKAPICLPDGKTIVPTKGTPQGGILSPLLANIVLNELDWWVASQWENFPTRHSYKTGKVDAKGKVIKDNSARYRAQKETKLKEMFIVRYADDFKIFCRSHEQAQKAYAAVTQWIKNRLKLDVSQEKSRVTNLRKEYTEFLGFKITTQQKGKKRVVKSRICDKARKKIANDLREKFKAIKSGNEVGAVVKINGKIYGVQQYYNAATLVSRDFAEIDFLVTRARQHAISRASTKKGSEQDLFIRLYGESKAKVNYLAGIALFPIHFARYATPINFSQNICNYTAEGRTTIHENLSRNAINRRVLMYLMEHPLEDKSALLNDNRISLYVGQNGKCAITGNPLEIGNMEVHHKVPISRGGSDRYSNLVFLSKDMHKLVHMTDADKIQALIQKYQLNDKQVAKLNQLRKRAFNFIV